MKKIHYGTLRADGKGYLRPRAACGADAPYGRLWSIVSSAVQGREKVDCKTCKRIMANLKEESPL